MPKPFAVAELSFDPAAALQRATTRARAGGRRGRSGHFLLGDRYHLRFSPRRAWYRLGTKVRVAEKGNVVFCFPATPKEPVRHQLALEEVDCPVERSWGKLRLVPILDPREARIERVLSLVLHAVADGRIPLERVERDYNKLVKLFALASGSQGHESDLAWKRAEEVATKLEELCHT
jgi:hypothetical protein